jgi:phosphatidylserine/phosphatidylglycerophosphate/cardiolipin synthase-like enzyme
MSRRHVLSALLTLPFVAAVLAPATPANAATTFETVFTYPTLAGAQDLAIENKVIELIGLAASGSTIHAGIYSFTRENVTDALLAANGRGVNVQVVAEDDEPTESPAKQRLRTGLPSGNFTYCDDGCLTSTAGKINHNKFYVFSALTDGRTNVVVQTSQNMTTTQTRMHNNAVIASGDAGLATAYRNYWAKLKARQPQEISGSSKSSDGKVELFFSPRNTSSDASTFGNSDIAAAMLNDVKCPDGKIRIGMAFWSTARPNITTVLAAKQAAGCSVEVLADDSEPGLPGLADAGIAVFGAAEGGCRYPYGNACYVSDVHSKYAIVEGMSTKAGVFKKFVYTGSHNYTGPAMNSNDETLMKVDDAATYDAFLADYNRQRNEAVKIEPSRYPNATYQTVNTEAGGDQDDPAMASNGAGDLAVVWEDSPGTANTNAQIFMRRYRNGTPVFEKSISGTGSGSWSHTEPDVAIDDAGNTVVVWGEDGDGNGTRNIKAVRLGPTGTVLGTVQANSASGGEQSFPSVSAEPDGDFVVAWESRSSPTATSASVHAARFSAGLARGYEKQVSAAGGTLNRRVDVALDPAGNAVFVWDEDSDGNGTFNVGLTAFNASGTVTLTERNANNETGGDQTQGSVAVNASGAFTVGWTDSRSGANRIWVRGFNAGGAERFTERVLTPVPAAECTECPAIGSQTVPQVGIDSNGRTIVAFDESESSGSDVWARGAAANGAFTGVFPARKVNPVTPGPQGYGAVTSSPSGDIRFGFTDDTDGNGLGQLRLRAGFTHN